MRAPAGPRAARDGPRRRQARREGGGGRVRAHRQAYGFMHKPRQPGRVLPPSSLEFGMRSKLPHGHMRTVLVLVP